MSSEADNAIEADSKIENEEAPPEVTDTTKEEVTKCDTSSEARVTPRQRLVCFATI